jgi:hypothetical protein
MGGLYLAGNEEIKSLGGFVCGLKVMMRGWERKSKELSLKERERRAEE